MEVGKNHCCHGKIHALQQRSIPTSTGFVVHILMKPMACRNRSVFWASIKTIRSLFIWEREEGLYGMIACQRQVNLEWIFLRLRSIMSFVCGATIRHILEVLAITITIKDTSCECYWIGGALKRGKIFTFFNFREDPILGGEGGRKIRVAH